MNKMKTGKKISGVRIYILAAIIAPLVSCSKKKSESGIESAEDIEKKKFFDSLKAGEFCSEIRFLNLRDDGLKSDLDLICAGDNPTELFQKLIAESYRGEGSLDRFTLSKIEELPGERSSFLVGFSQTIPRLNALNIRESKLKDVLLKEIDLGQYQRSVEKIGESKEDGLNFLRQIHRYKTLVKGPQSTEFRNERLTEINDYQVTVRREDLALSTEHLLDQGKNPNYDAARTITIVIGDPKDGGSFLITTVNFQTWNQGFHKINVRALEAITKKSAKDVYDYLIGESDKRPP